MGSSVPAALEYLAATTATLAPVQQLRAAVVDGWPAVRGDVLIVYGVVPGDGDSDAATPVAELSREDYEAVQVPAVVIVRRAAAGATQRARRDAFALLDAIREMIRADRRLGGAVKPGDPARMVGWTMSQTAEAKQAGEGRVCQIEFTLGWTHRG
ncbi:hypothetical protein AWW66_03315 [Micromonospora rosaria]|uniref:DUF3168 domain-containing protein n=1 Tax=Micromonospora rosaria TaxID=47874 RepID=A0A136PYT1_9ACTN|nr:hypothetical protein [Micromonospora rosaria]KXK63356.1 hypothetical protein AWW66_03315 [Micromonospora rosaria]